MEEKDVTFILQLGLIRDSVTLNASSFTLRTLKEAACDFVNIKVSSSNVYLNIKHNLLHYYKKYFQIVFVLRLKIFEIIVS